jgi:hypothetical protein
MRYIWACPPTNQSQDAKKGENFQIQNFKNFISKKFQNYMRLVHTTGKTWYKMLYQHTMDVISLFNISIKTNFKQITRVEIRLTNLHNTPGETTFCTWRHVICCSSLFCFAYVAYIDLFSPHSNDMTSWQNSAAEKISCSVAPFFYHHIVVMQHLISDRLLSLNSKENVQNVR